MNLQVVLDREDLEQVLAMNLAAMMRLALPKGSMYL